ncbi:hypothetical protein [Nitrososphaera viennensis]|uniref:Uncharacterized protein n=1 Tax=Nitrososphaera viennensis EN76 TaxID=926571 RepID=A0A060HHR2_9ARCH|nr:hypothetical protein [Nitrososphaera viennensis]AIC16139.1 hypothetical protein NVIE_1926 [Nitrososphaera viennensis EN76]
MAITANVAKASRRREPRVRKEGEREEGCISVLDRRVRARLPKIDLGDIVSCSYNKSGDNCVLFIKNEIIRKVFHS